MEIIKSKTLENKLKVNLYILIKEREDKYVLATYSAYKKWDKDGITYHSVFLSEEAALKYYDEIKEVQ